jgi:transcription initiation factor TFIIIB Brf1 subunit/transcription initiation factor TFIIB
MENPTSLDDPDLLDEIWKDFFTSVSLKETEKECEQNCKGCGSNEENFKELGGDLTCINCGYIKISRMISNEPEWNNYVEEGVMNGSGIRCGTTLDPTNPYDTTGEFVQKYHWTWHLDSDGVKRYTNLSKIAIRVGYSSKQRAFDEGKYSFEKIQEILSLSPRVFNTAKLFWGIILKTDILKRGGNRRGMKACCIFYACLSEKQQRNREDISTAFDIDGSTDFTKGEKIFREIFEKNKDYSWILYKDSENECMYSRYVVQLGLPFKVNKIMNLVKEHTREHLLGIAAKSEIAGILYFVVKEVYNLKHPNKSEIAKCIGICNPTLNKVIEILKFFYNKNKNLMDILNLKAI